MEKGDIRHPVYQLNDYSTKYHLTKPTSSYATWFTAGGAIHSARYDVNDDVITRNL